MTMEGRAAQQTMEGRREVAGADTKRTGGGEVRGPQWAGWQGQNKEAWREGIGAQREIMGGGWEGGQVQM